MIRLLLSFWTKWSKLPTVVSMRLNMLLFQKWIILSVTSSPSWMNKIAKSSSGRLRIRVSMTNMWLDWKKFKARRSKYVKQKKQCVYKTKLENLKVIEKSWLSIILWRDVTWNLRNITDGIAIYCFFNEMVHFYTRYWRLYRSSNWRFIHLECRTRWRHHLLIYRLIIKLPWFLDRSGLEISSDMSFDNICKHINN